MAGPGLDGEIADALGTGPGPGEGDGGQSQDSAPQSTLEIARAALNEQKGATVDDDGAPGPRSGEPAGERARAADGKFVPRTDRPAPDRTGAPAAPAAPLVASDPLAAPLDPAAPVVDRPPPGWSPQSKVDFDKLPPHIKADIVKREREVDAGLAKLAVFKPVEKYHEAAIRGGTTLANALENYYGIEQVLRKDVFAGVARVLANVGIKDPRQFIAAWQARLGGDQQPAPLAPNPPPSNQTLDPRQIIAQVRQEIRGEQERGQIDSVIAAFEADPSNRFYANVADKIPGILASGTIDAKLPMKERLQAAYDVACYADPAIRPYVNAGAAPARRIVNAQAADQARRQAKAVIGAPARGIPAAPGPKPGQSVMDTAREALAAQKGARI